MYLQKKQKKNFSLKGRFRKKKRLLRYLDFVEFYLMDNPVGVRVGSTIVQVFMALKCIEDWGMDYEMKWGRSFATRKGIAFYFHFSFFFSQPRPWIFSWVRNVLYFVAVLECFLSANICISD